MTVSEKPGSIIQKPWDLFCVPRTDKFRLSEKGRRGRTEHRKGTGQKCGSCEEAKLSSKVWTESFSVVESATYGERAENDGGGSHSHPHKGFLGWDGVLLSHKH